MGCLIYDVLYLMHEACEMHGISCGYEFGLM